MSLIVTDRLTWHMEVNHLFNRFQSGFRKLLSCQDHIVRLQDDIQMAIHAKYSLCGVFVDVEKAFDLMWTDGQLHKLQQHNITGQMLVVGKRGLEKQTKESARSADKRPSPGYCVAICFYYAALGHMFVLVGCGRGARPYVSIMRR